MHAWCARDSEGFEHSEHSAAPIASAVAEPARQLASRLQAIQRSFTEAVATAAAASGVRRAYSGPLPPQAGSRKAQGPPKAAAAACEARPAAKAARGEAAAFRPGCAEGLVAADAPGGQAPAPGGLVVLAAAAATLKLQATQSAPAAPVRRAPTASQPLDPSASPRGGRESADSPLQWPTAVGPLQWPTAVGPRQAHPCPAPGALAAAVALQAEAAVRTGLHRAQSGPDRDYRALHAAAAASAPPHAPPPLQPPPLPSSLLRRTSPPSPRPSAAGQQRQTSETAQGAGPGPGPGPSGSGLAGAAGRSPCKRPAERWSEDGSPVGAQQPRDGEGASAVGEDAGEGLSWQRHLQLQLRRRGVEECVKITPSSGDGGALAPAAVQVNMDTTARQRTRRPVNTAKIAAAAAIATVAAAAEAAMAAAGTRAGAASGGASDDDDGGDCAPLDAPVFPARGETLAALAARHGAAARAEGTGAADEPRAKRQRG
ncbi:hypothetical protein HYH03_014028 [Edaphochlamys debaryana]|uniref:Uncharacterized protein n=1 Tax=Edaphochlamys debaryana TaxID=47281 RepID=A0A835XS89_9CHLO|nr:hypothetical protein HYH03_014028 [Edaphochlamys debaryana]|eukprot:KAG2487311.1 hypothetical protein HYH03_014028 [Edaphochlamys debaryana]